MPSLPVHRFIVSLPFGQNNVRGIHGLSGFLRQHFIHRAGNGVAAGNNTGLPIHPAVHRVFFRRVVQHFTAPNHHGDLHLRKLLSELLNQQFVQHNLSAVVRDQQEPFRFHALPEKGFHHSMVPVFQPGLLQQLQKFLVFHHVHRAEVNIIPRPRVSQRGLQGMC